MRMVFLTLFLLAFGLALTQAEAAAQGYPVAPIAALAETDNNDEAVEGASPADRSPLEDLNPAESDWKVWIGPILIGIFGLILLFLIRRFSMGGRNAPRDGDKDQSSDR